jgi:enterochelin esterase family protein
MPAYVFPEAAIRPDDIPRGSLSDNITFHSEHLPYAVTYRVYTPFGYESLSDLPVIYVADGQEYLDDDLGSMVIMLDNLIADGSIQPIIAVFLDPRNAITGSNRRASQYTGSHTFDAFLIEELVPTIDSTYRTGTSADTRAILGSSFGGMLAAHVGLKYSDTFGLIGMHSPVFLEYDLIRAYAENDRLPLKVFMSVGTLGDAGLDLRRYVRDLFLDKGYPLRYIEVNDGHAWGNYRRMTDDTLIYFFGQE